MYLSPIAYKPQTVFNNLTSNKCLSKTEVSFQGRNAIVSKHHSDFYALYKKYEILASNYFRRGCCWGSPSDKFGDVIKALKIFFNENLTQRTKDDKVKMLIGGIGESQEPFSLLAVIKKLIGKKDIKDVLDLHVVDLQAQPSKKLFLSNLFMTTVVNRNL